MNCNTTHYRANSSSVPGDPTYTSSTVVADFDGDGFPDVFFANGGDYYMPGSAQPAVVYRNRGDGTFDDVGATSFGAPSSRLRQIAIGDVDGDGRLDVYMPGAYGLDLDRLFIQRFDGTFEDETTPRLPAGLQSRAGAAHFGDLDGDGSLDLVVTDWGANPAGFLQGTPDAGDLHVFFNDGGGIFSPAPEGMVPGPLDPTMANTPIDVDLVDVNGDLALDVVVDMRNGRSRLLVNDGKGKLTEATDKLPPKNGPYSYNIQPCDLDNDTDIDLAIDNAAASLGKGHRTQLLYNDGTGAFYDASIYIEGEPSTDDNIVRCVDVNDDGAFDLVVGSLENPSEKLLLNDGTGRFTYVAGAIPTPPGGADPTLGLDVGDFDGDGLVDFVTSQGEGFPRLNRVYRGAGHSLPDSRAPAFRAVESPTATAGAPIVLRFALSDRYPSEVGQIVAKIDASFVVGTDAPSTPLRARWIGSDLFRLDVPPQDEGTMLTVSIAATDAAGNMAKAPDVMLTVGPPANGGAGGGSGAGGDTGASGDTGAGGDTGSAGDTGTAGDQGTGGSGDAGGSGSSGGCGCALAGDRPAAATLLAIAAFSVFARLRRRLPRRLPDDCTD